MRKSVQTAASAVLVLSFATITTGVNAASHQTAKTTAPKLKTGVTVSLWDYFGAEKNNAERATLLQVANAWAKSTHNHVNLQGNTNANNTKMCVAAPANQAPDLVGVPHDQVADMYACKAVQPVPSWAWTPAQKSQFIKAGTQATTIGGKSYSIPWAIETTGIFYNRDLVPTSFWKAGTKLPWATVIKKAQSLTDLGSGKFGLGWSLTDFYLDYNFLSANGGYVFKYGKKGFDYNNIGLDNAGAVKGIQFIKDLTTEGKYKLVPTTMNDDTAKGLFGQGKMAMYITGPWNEPAFKAANVHFAFAPLPSQDGKHVSHPFSGLQVFALNRFSKHTNEAASLLAYLGQHLGAAEFKTSGRIPVLKSLLKSKAVTSDPVARGLAQAAFAAQPMPNIPEMAKVWTPMADAVTLVVKGKASANDAAHQAVTKIKSLIAAAHGG